jgi:ribosome biogenesis GTPase / thiamine phosphate phosphatase
LEKGLIIKSTGSRYRVLFGENNIAECTIKGKLRVREMKNTNPVAVGDNVFFELDPGRTTGVIAEVLDRKNYIIRKASNLSKQSQVIAANVDQLFLMVTVILPETPVEFIDRFLVTAEAYRIPAKLVFNKTDLYGPAEIEKMGFLISLYSKIGYECFSISIARNENTEVLKVSMKNKINLLSGNSGVGKTTLLNLFNPSLNLKTEEISDYHKQGKHITTYPEMHPMPFGGYIIDTPGIRGFGVFDMDRKEIYHFFPEIFKKSKECRFYNCLHLEEPGCAVRTAVENEEIHPLRYRSYLNIMEDDNRKYR